MKILAVSALACAIMALTAAVEWSWMGGPYITYVEKYMTWADAEKNCISLGGHLASMHGLYHRNVIKNLIFKKSRNPDSWLGGSDSEEEGAWRWTDGTAFDYDNWCPGEPNNGPGVGQNCLYYNAGRRCWDDNECEKQFPSVCMKAEES
ncbi:Hypothetical predicted protein [Xyrichtys novacula]|uniref:C-type lectin domain-containing protein n=1 Tax=Xyrichtys novacula TaxID=13765 RepID=A0AAV1HJ99_XYRNO|nr:Hypothetical predicted protein [Xyrichtys novacula]